jgi:hypothetical protein
MEEIHLGELTVADVTRVLSPSPERERRIAARQPSRPEKLAEVLVRLYPHRRNRGASGLRLVAARGTAIAWLGHRG